MSFGDLNTQVEPWDPTQGDLGRQHVLYTPYNPPEETHNELISAGFMPCPKCKPSDYGKAWLSPDNKAMVQSTNGYYTCPKCRNNTDLMENLPWHGVEEPDYYPRDHTGGGTNIGLPMEDVGQIAENIVYKMHTIPGYGPITWWHGSALDKSALDGATSEWGIEVKGVVYDSASHYWHPGDRDEATNKNEQAREMGLKGVLGILVLENFRTDTADVYVKAMPNEPWQTTKGRTMPGGVVKWHKRTGVKVAADLPFESPYKDPASPAPGPYSLEKYYNKPQSPIQEAPPEEMPF